MGCHLSGAEVDPRFAAAYTQGPPYFVPGEDVTRTLTDQAYTLRALAPLNGDDPDDAISRSGDPALIAHEVQVYTDLVNMARRMQEKFRRASRAVAGVPAVADGEEAPVTPDAFTDSHPALRAEVTEAILRCLNDALMLSRDFETNPAFRANYAWGDPALPPDFLDFDPRHVVWKEQLRLIEARLPSAQ